MRRVLARAGGDLQHVDAALRGRRQVGLQHFEDGLLVAGRRRGEALAWIGRVAGEADTIRLCHGSSPRTRASCREGCAARAAAAGWLAALRQCHARLARRDQYSEPMQQELLE